MASETIELPNDACTPACFKDQGRCVQRDNETVCECKPGFEGEHCGNIVIFSFSTKDEKHQSNTLQIIIPCIFVAFVALVIIFIVRRYKKVQDKKTFRKRQTRSTIEGVTVVPDRPSSTQLTYDSVSNNNEPISDEKEAKRAPNVIITRMSSFNNILSDKYQTKQYQIHENIGYKSVKSGVENNAIIDV